MENLIVEKSHYSAGILLIDDRILLTKEKYKDVDLLKLPGGMQEEIDLNQKLWIDNFKKLLELSGFSNKEIDFLSQQESLLKRTPPLKSLIRKFLGETGIYPSIFEHVFFNTDTDHNKNKKIYKNFFFVKGYFQSDEIKVVSSNDVKKAVFYYPAEVLDDSLLGISIFRKHRIPLEKGLALDSESEQINIESLSEFSWQ
jgi:hypothetical protein